MAVEVPLLNEYKRKFFCKRFPQTIFGGPKFKVGGPAYVYIAQMLLFLLPMSIGAIFTAVIELGLLSDVISCVIAGVIMIICSLGIQLTSYVMKRRRASIISPAEASILDEEDTVDFDGCCGQETINFVLPPKKYVANIIFHSLLSGVVAGWSTYYLLPTTLADLFTLSRTHPGVLVLYIVSWFAVSIAEYPLTTGSPPETAVYRTTDRYETLATSRAFYVLVCCAVHILETYDVPGTRPANQALHIVLPVLPLLWTLGVVPPVDASTDPVLIIYDVPGTRPANQALHVVLPVLPVLWTLGVVPPVDACVLWAMEQALFVLCGGTPMASDLRLFLMSVASVASFLVAYFVPLGCQTSVIMSACGYLLSLDLGGLGTKILRSCQKDDNQRTVVAGFLWSWSWREFVFHLGMLIVACAAAGITCFLVADADRSVIADYLGYAVIAVLVLEVVLADGQSVFVCLGLCRNAAYPPSVERKEKFVKRRRRLRVLGHIRRALMDFSPLLMLVYLAVSINFTPGTGSTIEASSLNSAALNVLAANRAFRWIWQSSQNSLLELSLAHILRLSLPSSDPVFLPLGLPAQLTILSVCRDRAARVADKIYYWFALTITSWADTKQRRRGSAVVLALNVVLFPLVFVAVLVSACLAAPLLPLFTLPVFLVGFPRPERFWPGDVGVSQNTCGDTVYYQQAAPQLAKTLAEGFATGSMGWPSPGRHYLVRFQDRLAWIQVLERGYGFCTLSIKGMELQETSCHTVEATTIDDIIEETFENKSKCGCYCNSHVLNTLRPYDAAYVKTYSDAKNQLTGVIDSPDTLRMIRSSFVTTLLWVFVQHINANKAASSKSSMIASSKSSTHNPPVLATPSKTSHNATGKASEKTLLNGNLQLPQRTASVNSFANSAWSDDNDSLLGETTKYKSKPAQEVVPEDKSNFQLPPVQVQPSVPAPGTSDKNDIDDLFDQLDFGLPATDVNKQTLPSVFTVNHQTNNNMSASKSTSRTKPLHFNLMSKHSNHLAIPEKWLSLPVDQAKIGSNSELFKSDWFKFVISRVHFELSNGKAGEMIANEVSEDSGLLDMYRNIVLACFTIVYDLGLSGSDAVSAGPSFVNKMFGGEIPWSVASDWLTDDKELQTLVLKAFRYAVKLSIDQVLLGEASSLEELAEYLEEYHSEWYLGRETEAEWNLAVNNGTTQLFCLNHDKHKSAYTSRVLTCQDTAIYISSLSPESVHAQWANLSQELLYMTNDDEERYSIQAHATLLRNLTTQAADPPLGYPIYASEAISVPTL